MARVLALTQLLIVGFGAPLLHVLVRVQHKSAQPGTVDILSQFLARHVLWLFAAPILYAAIATALQGRINEKAIRFAGLAICVILLVLIGIPVGYYLF